MKYELYDFNIADSVHFDQNFHLQTQPKHI